MRAIERTSAFKHDFKRIKAAPRHSKNIDDLLSAVLTLLATDQVLPMSCHDHPLGGEWKGYRDCHLKPDLLIIYAKPDKSTLRLVRLGSHSELFG